MPFFEALLTTPIPAFIIAAVIVIVSEWLTPPTNDEGET
jgi:hypothetical protein